MQYPLEALIAIVVILVCFGLYRRLINSPMFNRVVDETIHPTASDEEVVQSYDKAVRTAKDQIAENEAVAETKRQRAQSLRKRIYKGE